MVVLPLDRGDAKRAGHRLGWARPNNPALPAFRPARWNVPEARPLLLAGPERRSRAFDHQQRDFGMAQDTPRRRAPRRLETGTEQGASCEEHREALLDDALDDSFPASDPPAITQPSRRRC